jgi:hypothetical protein
LKACLVLLVDHAGIASIASLYKERARRSKKIGKNDRFAPGVLLVFLDRFACRAIDTD